MSHASPHLLDVRLFGSVARGDVTPASDLDVLAVVSRRLSPAETDDVRAELCGVFGTKADVAFYTLDRLREMFVTGHPFAWHLAMEARRVDMSTHVLESLPTPPRPPVAAITYDVGQLSDLAHSVRHAGGKCPASAAYEAGIAYVCIRNAAISASFILLDRPVFAQSAPFVLSGHLGMRPPVCEQDYRAMANTRRLSLRGEEMVDRLDWNWLASRLEGIESWMDAIQSQLLGASHA
jgi:predicted nucleotidyltransferase